MKQLKMVKKEGLFIVFEGIDGGDEPHINKYNEYKKLSYNHPNAHFYEQSRNIKAIRSSGAYGYLLRGQSNLELENYQEAIKDFNKSIEFRFNISRSK